MVFFQAAYAAVHLILIDWLACDCFQAAYAAVHLLSF